MTEVLGNGNNDMLSELLIAKLLEEDVRLLENARAAEELQLNETIASSALADGRFPKKGGYKSGGVRGAPSIQRPDEDIVIEVLAAEINATKDALIAQSLQHASDSNMASSRQYAQKLAAAEKKNLLDAEFARRLQQAIDDGEDDDNLDAER